jgi:NAD(P)-dependent dehydrogenase (short-subunit alcohol dehydrogenase family)
MDLEGRVAIVTGASRGLGKCFALALARAGASVVVSARTDRPGALPGTIQETVEEIRAAGGRAIAIRCDTSIPTEVQRLVGETAHKLRRLDILVNNAALADRMPFPNVSPEFWDAYFHTNVQGPYFAAQAATPHLREQGGGSIINISSGASTAPVVGQAMRHHGLYAMSKAALDRLSTWLAAELRSQNIAVNSLNPGPNITDGLVARFPVDFDFESGDYAWKEASVEHLGPPIVCLAKQDAQGITGRVLEVSEFGVNWP